MRSPDDFVLTLHQSGGIGLSRHVTEPHIVRQRAEKRDAFTDQHGHAGDGEALNQAGAQEVLDRNPAVDVDVLHSIRGEFRHNLRRFSGHLFDHSSAPDFSSNFGEVDWPATKDHDALVFIWPLGERQNDFVGVAANYQRIHRGHELDIAVGFAAVRGQKIERAVQPGNETVNAGADKDRYRHRPLLDAGQTTGRIEGYANAVSRDAGTSVFNNLSLSY